MLSIKKQEAILIALGIAMIGLIIGYNAFYIASPGEMVVVYTDSEEQSQEESYFAQASDSTGDFAKEENTIVIDGSAKVNINSATLEQLMQLEGIGETKAQAIIQYREENGGFSNIEEIKEVNGIGESVFESIKSMIVV